MESDERLSLIDNSTHLDGGESTGSSPEPHYGHKHLAAIGALEADVILQLRSPYFQDDRHSDTSILNTKQLKKLHEKLVVETSNSRNAFPRLVPKLEGEDSQDHTLQTLRLALLQDLCESLPAYGFTVRLFKSNNHKYIFVRISIDPGETEEVLADRMHVRLQTTRELIPALNIKQDTKTVMPTYLPYKRAHMHKVQSNLPLGKEVMQRYHLKYQEGSIVRSVDRIRMIYTYLNEVIDLNECCKLHLMKSHYPCHSQNALQEFRTDWARFEIVFLTWSQPITRLRDYFGESIAYQYAWLGFTCKGVAILAVPAVLLSLSQAIWNYPLSRMCFAWCLISVVWQTAWSLLWKRKESFYAECWDMRNQNEQRHEIRPHFRFELRESRIDGNETERFYPHWKAVISKWVGWAITAVCILNVICVVAIGYHYAKPFLNTTLSTFGYRASRSMFTGLFVSACNFAWKRVVPTLVEWENPRTLEEYRAALWAKTMAFQSVNSYLTLFFLSYAHAFFANLDDEPVEDERRMEKLQFYVFSTFVCLAACDIMFAFVYMAYLMRASIKREAQRSTTTMPTMFSRHDSPDPIGNSSRKQRVCFMEMQAESDEYTPQLEIIDSVDATVTLGYVLLFGVVSPLLVVVCFFVLMIKMRLTAWTLCCFYKRPYPWRAQGLNESQREVLQCLAWIGLANSIGIPLFNLKRFREWERPSLWCLFFLWEHGLIVLKLIVGKWLWPRSSWEDLIYGQRKRVEEAFVDCLHQTETAVEVDISKRAVDCEDDHIDCISQRHPEWRHLQSEDTWPGTSCARIRWLPSTSPEGGLDDSAIRGIEIHDPLGSQFI